MAQLLGICSDDQIEIDFTFKGSAGIGDKNPDGWGYAYSKNDYWVIDKEHFEDNQFDKKEFSLRFPANFFSNFLISHIRFASQGRKTLENTQPFTQELFEKNWIFAHAGHLQMYRHVLDRSDYLQPKGETDSEEAFCSILGEVKSLGRLAADKEIAKRIEETATTLTKQGALNFLLSNRESLFAYFSGYKSLYYTELRPPFENNILGEDNQLWFTLFVKGQDIQITIIASEPLISDVHWKKLDMNTLYSFKNGKRIKYVI